ncbi:MAG TPA: hypothetical protein VGW38_09825, partial [Chloroflexota bacterium]|nr:hypothetical protein [Chloroflexota bacterium]
MPIGVAEAVAVTDAVAVGTVVLVGVPDGVEVIVAVAVAVADTDADAVAVCVAVAVDVLVGVGAEVLVAVGLAAVVGVGVAAVESRPKLVPAGTPVRLLVPLWVRWPLPAATALTRILDQVMVPRHFPAERCCTVVVMLSVVTVAVSTV